MKPFELRAAILSLSLISSVTAAGAVSISFSSLEQAAEKSYDQHQYKKAETSLLKAFDAAQTDGTKDLEVARARVLLAKVYRESARPQKANEQLELALTIYKRLGFAEPVFADERTQLFKDYKQVDPGTLGRGYEVLKNNAAVISIVRKDAGAHVEFIMPAPLEKSLNSAKVDGLQFESVVAFDIVTEGDGKVHASNIKGFKIHSVEKNTWANLLDLSVGGPANSEGTYDAQIIAGKGGFTKTVAAKLPEKAYEPVLTIANQITSFGAPPALGLPIAAAPAEVAPTASPATSITTTSTATTISPPAATTVTQPAVMPTAKVQVTAPSWSESMTTKVPASTPAITSTPVPASTAAVSVDQIKTASPISTTSAEAYVPKVESTSTTTAISEPVVAVPPVETKNETKIKTQSRDERQSSSKEEVKSKHDDDDDLDDKAEELRKQQRREARREAEAASESMKSDAKKHHDHDKDDDDDDDKKDKDKDKDKSKD